MNDGQYTNIRNYLEEIASVQRQLLTEQKRTNELLASSKSTVDYNIAVNEALNKMFGKATEDVETPPEVDAIMPAPAASKPKTPTPTKRSK